MHQIIEACDLFVFNMNGCVPDDGGMVELAIALVHGNPIVIFKDDLEDVCIKAAIRSKDTTWYALCEKMKR